MFLNNSSMEKLRVTTKNEIPSHHYVMLVDDDDDDCDFFSETFISASAMSLHIVKSGNEMFNFLNRKILMPQLIFLDLNMPAKNGYDCLRELKADEELNKIPVIIYSTSALENSTEKKLLEHAHLYVRKPNSLNQLKSVIQKVMVTDFVKTILPKPRELFHVFEEE